MARVAQIRQLDVSDRRRAVSDFLSRADNVRLFRQIAFSLVNRYGLTFARDGDDVLSEVRIVAYRTVVEDDMFESASCLPSWPTAVSLKAQNVVRAQVEAGHYSGVCGASSRMRRTRGLARVRAQMCADIGVEPSGRAVIEAFNAEKRRRLKDPVRQGMVATEADLVPLAPLPLDPALDLPADGGESDCPIIPAEARRVIQVGVGRCWAVSERLGAAAEAVYGAAIDGDPPFVGRVEDVMAVLGVDRGAGQRLWREVTDVMIDVLWELLGIGSAAG